MRTIAMTIPLSARSLVRIPRRNLVLHGGDSLALRVSLVDADRPDAAPLDLAGLSPRLRLAVWHERDLCDYGWLRPGASVLASIYGEIDPAAPGVMVITVPAATLYGWCGRSAWGLQAEYGGGASMLVSGVLHVLPGTLLPDDDVGLLDDDFGPLLADDFSQIEV